MNISLDAITFMILLYKIACSTDDDDECSALKLGGFPSHLITILLEATWTMTIA